MLIGITGAARHGKDSAASALVEKYGFVKLGFADAVREMAAAIDPYVHTGQNRHFTEGDTPFARYSDVLKVVGYETAKSYGDVRRLLQRIGTEAGREVLGHDVWLMALARKMGALGFPGANIVINDVRFENEAEFVKQMGGYLIRVVRPNFYNGLPALHPSESAIAALDVDYEIETESFNDLQREALDAFLHFGVMEGVRRDIPAAPLSLDQHDFIVTYSGRRFDIFNATPDEVAIEDIAHALSMLCRFTGHCVRFYSVAQHAWQMSFLVPQEFALEALLHDSAEAYVNDLSRPLKHHPSMARYRDTEQRVDHIVRARFGLPNITAEPYMSPEVKDADNRMVCTEARQLLAASDWSNGHEAFDIELDNIGPVDMETLFLERFRELTTTKLIPVVRLGDGVVSLETSDVVAVKLGTVSSEPEIVTEAPTSDIEHSDITLKGSN